MKNLKIVILLLLITLLDNENICSQSLAEQKNNRGLEYAIQGEFEKARVEFEEALKVDSNYRVSEFRLEVINDFMKQEIKKETAIHLFEGGIYGNKGEYDKVINEFTKAIELNPDYAKAYYSRGITYFNKREYDKANNDHTKAIELNTKFAEAYYERGLIYSIKGQNDEAIGDYTQAIEIKPMYAEAYNNRGNEYYMKGKNDEAISDYSKAIEIKPQYAEAYNNLGNGYAEKGQFEEAISNYTKAIEINPEYTDAYTNRGYTYFVDLGDKEKGCADYKKACELGNCNNYNIVRKKGDCQ